MFETEKQMIAHGTLELSRWFGNFHDGTKIALASH